MFAAAHGVLEYLRQRPNTRFVYASSSKLFGSHLPALIDGETPTIPTASMASPSRRPVLRLPITGDSTVRAQRRCIYSIMNRRCGTLIIHPSADGCSGGRGARQKSLHDTELAELLLRLGERSGIYGYCHRHCGAQFTGSRLSAGPRALHLRARPWRGIYSPPLA